MVDPNAKQAGNDIIADDKELKKLVIINKVVRILSSTDEQDKYLQQICNTIPKAYQYSEFLSVCISYDDVQYKSNNFKKTQWLERQPFETPDKKKGAIEIYFSKEYLELEEKDILLKDSSFLESISALIAGAISKNKFEKLVYDNTERVKELKGLNRTAEILNKGITLEESLQEICNFLPEAWQYPLYTTARITYDNKVFKSKKFKEAQWVQKQSFETPDNRTGEIEVFYLKEFPDADEGPFLKEERDLIDNLAALISGVVSKNSLRELLINNTERLKELRGINQTSLILKQSNSLEEALQIICSILPEAWQYPEFTAARILYEGKVFTSTNFKVTKWVQKQEFEAPGNKRGIIEIFYLKEFREEDEGPFLKEERNLLINLANLIAGSAAKNVFNKLQSENRERLKELWAINQTSQIIAQCKPIDETLQHICDILPRSWQYPKYTAVRIRYEGENYTSKKFNVSEWSQSENFITIDNKKGVIEIFYLKEFPKIYEGPFLKEERQLLINLGKLISGYLNNVKGREIYRSNILKDKQSNKPEAYRKSLVKNKQPLQLFFNKQVIDKYIYLDMMKYKVKEILFVATLYDAFILENEDSFFEQFMGEIYQYSLFSLPRIIGVSTAEEALEILQSTHFDIVILMVGLDKEAPLILSDKIKQNHPNLPVYLLLNQKSNIKYFEDLVPAVKSVDELFIWNGDSQIFFGIVKSIEDKANIENDTKLGLVRVILLIEDSAQYYSKYLQMLYSIVFDQVKQLLPEVEKNELDKIAKMRSRPKIIHVKNYEDALFIFNKYKDFLLCVISDVEFERNGKLDKTAGIKFISYVKSHILNLPIILQSSEPNNINIAKKLNVGFINKNSESLFNDLKKFLNYYFGFGDFTFRDKNGKQIAVAKTLKEFEELLSKIPAESLYLHAIENQFSLWLMARGEIQLAKTLNPLRIGDFNTLEESRNFFIETIKLYNEEKKKGKILSFVEKYILDEKNIVSFSGGSFGGKGRGLAFINALIYSLDYSTFAKGINIRTPITVIIGTDEFESFIENNNLHDKIFHDKIPYKELRKHFVESNLSDDLVKKLEIFVNQVDKPIAVRSSSLSEDSLTQPFAGIFDTYIVPRQCLDNKKVLNRLTIAIKLVFASIYSDEAKTYFKAIHHKVEGEKMAVILQELVGHQYGDYYYPHISGVAQSYNYYPVANMKPEEGFAMAAFGLGSYVVEGWKSYRFSPKYPKIEMFTTKDLINSTQVKFYAVNCNDDKIDFLKDGELASLKLLDINEARKHGTLNHCASVYNIANDRIELGANGTGPVIVNFAEILKHNYIPLSETIDAMLDTIKEALGSPVEIEYAVDLNRTENNLPSFYLLQIKPLVGNQLTYNIDFEKYDKNRMVLFSTSCLGNGEIENIQDVIYVDIERFDKLRTYDMVSEIEGINNQMMKQKKRYILIGPGRWGTRDQHLGIPVNWSQISNAKVIVEISLPNYPLDSSLGSHFFHNVTSMNIGYFSVFDSSQSDFIKWDVLNNQEKIHETKYFKHIKFKKPLNIFMNGKQKSAAIIQN